MGTRSIKTIKATARQLKAYVDEADKNKDGLVSARELKNAGYSSGQRGSFARASLSVFAATAKGAVSTSTTELKKAIDTTVTDLAKKDFDRDGFLEAGGELTSARRSKRLAALYDLAPGSAVQGYGGYGRGGETMANLLGHTRSLTTTTARTPAEVSSTVRPFLLAATGARTVAEALERAGGAVTVRRFHELRTDEAHTLVSWNNDSSGALFANRRKELTARINGSVVQPT